MIQIASNSKARVWFGQGTVSCFVLKEAHEDVVRISFNEIPKHKIGEEAAGVKFTHDKTVTLLFDNLRSLDVVMKQLEVVKELLLQRDRES